MRAVPRTDDDVDYLRNLLTPLDPAIPGRTPAGVHPERPGLRTVPRRRSWAAAGFAAAAVVVVILAGAVPLLRVIGSTQTPASAPTARPSYDHVQWRDYRGTQLMDTVDRWWNGVDGRDVHRDASGTVTADVTLLVAPTSSATVVASYSATPVATTAGTGPATPTAGPVASPPDPTPGPPAPNAAIASPAPTSGIDLTADEFPGVLPSTADGLAEYLDSRHFTAAQGMASLPFQRCLDASQMAALVSLARAGAAGPRVADLPTGQPGRVLTFAASAHGIGNDTRLVLDSSGNRVLGTSYVADGQTWWRLITVSELTASAG
jgi:hypothetical protein